MGVSVMVYNLAGKCLQVTASDHWTLQDLKLHVEAVSATPVLQQRLLRGCNILSNDGATISSLLADDQMSDDEPEENQLELTLVCRSKAQTEMLSKIKASRGNAVAAFQVATDDAKADKDLALAAVQQDAWALRYVAGVLKADRDVVMAAVKQNGWALSEAAEELKADKQIALAAVKQDGMALQYVARDLAADKDIVVAAVQQHGWALQFAADGARANRDIVLAAVQRDGWALRFAAEDMVADRTIVLAAVRQNALVRHLAAPSLQEDAEVSQAAGKVTM